MDDPKSGLKLTGFFIHELTFSIPDIMHHVCWDSRWSTWVGRRRIGVRGVRIVVGPFIVSVFSFDL